MAAHLPRELLRQIIQEFISLDGDSSGRPQGSSLMPLAMVNRHWLSILEAFLWNEIIINPSELDSFRAVFSKVSRRQSLKHLVINSGTWFQSNFMGDGEHELPDDDEEYGSGEDAWDWDDGNVPEDHDDLEERALVIQQETRSFFQQMQQFWNELACWGQDLHVYRIRISMDGDCLYSHLGRGFRASTPVEQFLAAENWLDGLPDMPMVPSVRTLELEGYPDLWPAIVSCRLARTLPNLQKLELSSQDYEKTWYYARKHLRGILARELATLPPSLSNLLLSLPYTPNWDQKIALPTFLEGGVDLFSRSLSSIATNLTRLSIYVSNISPEFFWEPEALFPSSHDCRPVRWPNLREMHVVTGLAIATARFWMRPSDPQMLHWPIEEDPGREVWFSDDEEESERLIRKFGDRNLCQFRDRPEPSVFNTLAINIARAVSCSPVLRSISLQFEPHSPERYHEYEGWGFFFRSGSNAQKPKCWMQNREYGYCEYPGIDTHPLHRPRSEWVFRCPHHQLQWEEPEEAKMLWRERFSDMDFDTVTCEIEDAYGKNGIWYRRRNGQQIGPAVMDCATPDCTNCFYWNQDLESFQRRR